MRSYYKNDLKRAYLILEGDEQEQEDYQIHMLRENDIPGILKTDVRYVDNRCHYHYDISGKTSLRALHEKVHLKGDDIKRLIQSLLQAIQTLHNYMLDGTSILLDPDYIYCENEEISFCYYPSCAQNMGEEFHKLTEYFVREVDYKDEEGIRFAYTLHKATMEENYSIEKIMKTLDFEKEEEEPVLVDYVEAMENASIEENMVAEKRDMWEPIRRLLDRRKFGVTGYGSEDL